MHSLDISEFLMVEPQHMINSYKSQGNNQGHFALMIKKTKKQKDSEC